jgi:hypothetical protein
MLPPLEECRKLIQIFDRKYPVSTFNEFWSYKLDVEKNGSILDDPHLDETIRLLREKLLDNPKWVLAWTGIPGDSKIGEILKEIRPFYEKIGPHCLGQGRIKGARDELSQVYSGLYGITHALYRNYEPDPIDGFFIVGKAKVLMFIWGQTPGFDNRVRENLELDLRHVSREKNKYTPGEFCNMIEDLDEAVVAWNEKYKGTTTFQRLSPNRPVGRIIDIIYWIEDNDC